VDRFQDTAAQNGAFETFQHLDAMQPGSAPEIGEPAPAVHRFAPDAQAEFDDWGYDVETALQAGAPQRWSCTCPNIRS